MLKQLLRHSLWNAVATFSHQGSTFVGNFVVIRLLDHASYGKFSLINLTALYAANILQFGVGSTVSRFVARHLEDKTRMPAIVWYCGAFSLLSGLLGLAVMVSTAGFVARDVFIESSLAAPLAIAAASVPGLVGTIYLNGLLQGLHGFRALAVSSAVSGLLFVACIALGARVGSLQGAVLGFACGSVMRSFILGFAALIALGPRWRSSWIDVRGEWQRGEIAKFQFPAGLSTFTTLPTLWLVPTILTRETQNFSDVGSYSLILMLKTMVVLPAWVVALALQPSLERAWSLNETQNARRIFHTALLVGSMATAALAALVAIFPARVLLLFGVSFVSSDVDLQLMMLGAVAEGVAITLYMRIQMSNQMWRAIFVTLLPRDVSTLVTVALMASTYGLRGAIVAHVIGAAVNLAGSHWLSASVERVHVKSQMLVASRD
ncbi:oligosaccharide flippase family protein [Bradyrhizobium elkanii]